MIVDGRFGLTTIYYQNINNNIQSTSSLALIQINNNILEHFFTTTSHQVKDGPTSASFRTTSHQVTSVHVYLRWLPPQQLHIKSRRFMYTYVGFLHNNISQVTLTCHGWVCLRRLPSQQHQIKKNAHYYHHLCIPYTTYVFVWVAGERPTMGGWVSNGSPTDSPLLTYSPTM
jgi:hypothetical protein